MSTLSFVHTSFFSFWLFLSFSSQETLQELCFVPMSLLAGIEALPCLDGQMN